MHGNGRFRLSLLPGQSVSSEDKFKCRTSAKRVARSNLLIIQSLLPWLRLTAANILFVISKVIWLTTSFCREQFLNEKLRLVLNTQ